VGFRRLNAIFNENRYYERFLEGQYIACLKGESTNVSSNDEPPDTRSLLVWYMDLSGRRVCLVHFYLRADGSIGGSPPFRPEPKVLIHDGVYYQVA